MYPRTRCYSPPSLLSASNIPRVDHIRFGGLDYVSPQRYQGVLSTLSFCHLGVHVFVPLYGGYEEENGLAPLYETFDYRYESSEEESGGEESSTEISEEE